MSRRIPSNRGGLRFGLAFLAALVATPGALQAQRAFSAVVGLSAASHRAVEPAQEFVAESSLPRSSNPFAVMAASAVLPGSGQLLLRQRRGMAYLAIEATALAFYISQTRDGRRERDRYRRISREVARANFNPDGPRGDWDYYERMEKFLASGDFDATPGGAVDPETDEETLNGSVWLLARRTYWRDPEVAPDQASAEFTAAMRFYEKRAVPQDMRWSWIGEPEAYQQFRSSIAGSNSAFRSAGHTASVVIANHFLSAVDAYVSAQIRLRRNAEGTTSAIVSVPFRY